MLVFQYLDFLPAIPSELLVDPGLDTNNFVKKPEEKHKHSPAEKLATFVRWKLNNKILSWLSENISTNLEFAGLQKMNWPETAQSGKRLIIPHTDPIRTFALNYIFEPGGSNVTTTFYQEIGFPLLRESNLFLTGDNVSVYKQVVIEPCRWHLVRTNVLHGVENVETQRQSITISINSDDPLSVLKV